MSIVRSHRRLAAGIAVAAVLLAALVAVGRWERSRHARSENARMAAVFRLATVDGLNSRLLDGYRLSNPYDCLLYHPPGKPLETSAYEVCFDAHGRLVQTIDRDSGTAQIGSLLEQPSLATLRVPVRSILQIFVSRGLTKADARLHGITAGMPTLPISSGDIGAFEFPKHHGR
jgi:hypothetical protein